MDNRPGAMKRLRQVIFYTFLVSTISITAFAFWLFSRQADKEQIAKAFPDQSFQTYSNGKTLTLYSIEPFKQIENAEDFHGSAILGKTEITNRSFLDFITHAFLNDMANAFDASAACFNPRHGIRITDEKQTLDILICFECGNFVTFYGDKKGGGEVSGTSKILLNKILKDADIKLAE